MGRLTRYVFGLVLCLLHQQQAGLHACVLQEHVSLVSRSSLAANAAVAMLQV